MSQVQLSKLSIVSDKRGKKMQIRSLLPGDELTLKSFFNSLSPVARSSFQPHPFTTSFVRKMVQDYAAPWHLRMVVLDPSKKLNIVAYAFITRLPFLNAGYFGIAVTDAYQGRGLSSLLMKSLFESAASQRLKNVYLNVYTHNTPAIQAYQKQGFSKIEPPLLLSKFFALFELWYNGELSRLWHRSENKGSLVQSSIWMVKKLA